MQLWNNLPLVVSENWQIWLVTVVLIVAAVIDGWKLKVPNWLTFPFVLCGLIYSTLNFGWTGLLWSIVGTCVGLGLLLPLRAIGGMGAGDVKLMAGIGAWVWGTVTFYAFCLSALIGGALAVAMVLWQGTWRKHWSQFWAIAQEIWVIRNPDQLAAIAAERKSSMLLLPYGIPIAIGTISYFIWAGMLP
ncbi:MAG: A24 family peptidase [Thermoguttaceae bacterium]